MGAREARSHEAGVSSSKKQSRYHPERQQLISWSLASVDLGIACSLIVVPFFMGGRTSVGQLAFSAVAFWCAVGWSIHQTLAHGNRRWQRTLAFWPMAIAAGLVLLQIVPLPPGLLERLSPRIHEVLPLWNSGLDGQPTLGLWQTLSYTPAITRQSLTLLVSGVLLFVVTVQRIQHLSDVERIIRWLAISVSLMALFGIAQFLTSNGKFFWFYEHPHSSTDDCVKGAFTNRNHFAQFIALGFGALLWWVVCGASAPSRRPSHSQSFGLVSRSLSLEMVLRALLVPVCVFAVLMSFSRGGALALLASGATAVFLLRQAGKLSRKSFVALAGSGLFVCVGLSIYGYDTLSSRFEGDYAASCLYGRVRLWEAASEGFADHLATGTGLSSHRFVYPMYLEPKAEDGLLEYTHAENGYVQLALETGLPGLVLAILTLGFYFFWSAATLRTGVDSRVLLCFVAILPPLIANAVHSTMDFVWYVPGCMGILAVTGACACRLYQIERERSGAVFATRALPRLAWGGATLALILTATYSLPLLWQAFRAEMPWQRYEVLQSDLAKLDRDKSYEDIWARSEPRQQILVAMEKELSAALTERPDWALAHARKAGVHLELFNEFQLSAENSFDLRQIRETVLTNFDSSADASEWLMRAVGPHRKHLDAALQHAHRAVELGPLQGDAYILLAQLSFLEQPPSPTTSAYIDQAYRVQPNDGAVLFAIGEEAVLAHRPDLAIQYWKRSFQRGKQHQQRLLDVLAGQIPVQAFLDIFQPDTDSLLLIARHYERPELSHERGTVLAALTTSSEAKAATLTGPEAAGYWMHAARSHRELKEPDKELACLERAVAAHSTNFAHRFSLAGCYLRLGEYSNAEEQLRWCSQRKPGHPEVQTLLESAVRKRIASTGEIEQARLPAGENLGR